MSIQKFVTDTVKAQPLPPRKVNYFSLLRTTAVTDTSKTMVVMGTLFLMLAASRLTSMPGKIGSCILGTLFISVPVMIAKPIYKLLRQGRVETRVVESVEFMDAPVMNHTFDSMENGLARGKWRADNLQPEKFEIDHSCAKEVKPGTRIDMLVSGPEKFQQFIIGISA